MADESAHVQSPSTPRRFLPNSSMISSVPARASASNMNGRTCEAWARPMISVSIARGERRSSAARHRPTYWRAASPWKRVNWCASVFNGAEGAVAGTCESLLEEVRRSLGDGVGGGADLEGRVVALLRDQQDAAGEVADDGG